MSINFMINNALIFLSSTFYHFLFAIIALLNILKKIVLSRGRVTLILHYVKYRFEFVRKLHYTCAFYSSAYIYYIVYLSSVIDRGLFTYPWCYFHGRFLISFLPDNWIKVNRISFYKIKHFFPDTKSYFVYNVMLRHLSDKREKCTHR